MKNKHQQLEEEKEKKKERKQKNRKQNAKQNQFGTGALNSSTGKRLFFS